MTSKLTFNISDLNNKNFVSPDISKVNDLLKQKVILSDAEFNKASTSSWKTDSGELRRFIQNTFGINFDADLKHATHHRNKLNSIIKKVTSAKTIKYKKTILNFSDYTALITSDDFIQFISTRLMKDFKPKNQKKMYDELMFLQVNRYEKTTTFKKNNTKFIAALAVSFELLRGVGKQIDYGQSSNDIIELLKNLYVCHVDLFKINMTYESDQVNFCDEILQLLEITSYRFNQKSTQVYYFSSYDDVVNTSDEQLLRFFIRDVYRWFFNMRNGE